MTTYIPSLTLPSFIFEKPAASILLPVVLGTAIGYGCRPTQAQDTYLAITQPPLRPPPPVFGPVWTALYASMGYAAHRAWNIGMSSLNPDVVAFTKHGATLYTLQLGMNLVWMPLFFKFLRPVEATVDILALTGTTAYLCYIWGQVDETAGYLLAPYLGWLSFATYLTIGAGYLNGWSFADKVKVKK